jgi:hypothetical protein
MMMPKNRAEYLRMLFSISSPRRLAYLKVHQRVKIRIGEKECEIDAAFQSQTLLGNLLFIGYLATNRTREPIIYLYNIYIIYIIIDTLFSQMKLVGIDQIITPSHFSIYKQWKCEITFFQIGFPKENFRGITSERPKVVSAEISADISAEISAETEILAMPAETETEIHPFLKGE